MLNCLLARGSQASFVLALLLLLAPELLTAGESELASDRRPSSPAAAGGASGKIVGESRNGTQQQLTQRRQLSSGQAEDEYLVGVGITDITGPSADINLMGYAKPNQDAGGIHLRQFSRAIIVQDRAGSRIVYAGIDNGMVSQLLRAELLKRLAYKFGPELYNETNVMLSASHSHSCPGGFFQYLLYNIPSAGFIGQTLESLLEGVLLSVERAHEDMRPARIYYNQGELLDASVNRSPPSYQNNPAAERLKYKHDTDKLMQLLKIVDAGSGEPIAMVNWFAVHGTSMNNTNHLISSDNKGYAALLFEQEFNPPGTLPGKGKFVALFAQANEGDVSPNTRGPRCIDTGLPCDSLTSTCGNPPRNDKCIAFGPGKDMFESTKIIAHKQYNKARQLFLDQAGLTALKGPVKSVHEYVDMTRQVVPLYKSLIDLARAKKAQQAEPSIPLNASYRTCQAGLGYSFAAGTTDGPGAFDFQQADTASTRYWNMVRDFLKKPSPEQVQCHHPKPILLSTGEMDFPYMWHPRVVPTQIFTIGQFAIVGLPGEFTTMAGRRVRETVLERLTKGATVNLHDEPSNEDRGEEEDDDDDDDREENPSSHQARDQPKPLKRSKRAFSLAGSSKVALSGLSNIYTSYVTTVEEYEVQRYEGASTLYGPHTLQAYINQFRKLADHLVRDEPISSSVRPPDLSGSLFSFKTGVIFDGTPSGKSFGDVVRDVNVTKTYKCQDVVEVEFVAGNPRNDLRHGDSFLYVDRFDKNGTWTPIATDSSWETKFIWERTNTILGESKAVIIWEIPHNCMTGVYRIRHYGASKNLLQSIKHYSGHSKPFKVVHEHDSKAIESLDSTLLLAEQADEVPLDAHGKQERRFGHSNERSGRKPLHSALSRIFSWFTN